MHADRAARCRRRLGGVHHDLMREDDSRSVWRPIEAKWVAHVSTEPPVRVRRDAALDRRQLLARLRGGVPYPELTAAGSRGVIRKPVSAPRPPRDREVGLDRGDDDWRRSTTRISNAERVVERVGDPSTVR